MKRRPPPSKATRSPYVSEVGTKPLGVPSSGHLGKDVRAAMLSPDVETRMLLACYLNGDATLEALKNQVMDLASRVADGLRDHPLTSEVVLALYEHGFGAATEADLRRLFGDLFR